MANLPMTYGGVNGLPYSLSEMSTTGINSTRWTPIFGGWVEKSGVVYVDCLLELNQDLPNNKTFPDATANYDVLMGGYSELTNPKGNVAEPLTGLIVKRSSGGNWDTDPKACATEAIPGTHASIRVGIYSAITRGSDRYALRIKGQYITE